MLVCLHCGSQSITYDREYFVGEGWVFSPRCLKCGRAKFKEVVKEAVNNSETVHETLQSPLQTGESITKKEEGMARGRAKKKCACGNDMINSKVGVCADCFMEKYGISYETYFENKVAKTDSPAKVAERMKRHEQAGHKYVQQAKEDFESAMEEEKRTLTVEVDIKPVVTAKVTSNEKEKAEEDKEYSSKDLFDAVAKCLDVVAPALDIAPADTLLIDRELFNTLKREAAADFRTPEQQAAYYIHHGRKALGVA